MRKEKGITLIAVAVTIIVLLIVAMITITFVIGENGLFSRARKSAEHHIIESYRETVEVLRGKSEIEKGVRGISSKEYMDIYEEEANKDKHLEEATIKRKSEDTVRVITKEGYIFDVTEKGTEYIGKKEDFPVPPDLKEGDIKFRYNPSGWTNGDVKVGIEITKEEIKNAGYVLEYSINGKEWHKYIEEIEFKKNGAIYARLINEVDVTGGIATGNVANIDKVAPKEFTAEATVTTNSITVNGSTEDEPKTETNGCSGIARYEYSINNEEWQVSNVFNNLSQNTKYTIKMKAIDNAGNERVTSGIEKTTGGVPGLIKDTNLTFSYNPTEWTRGNVTVTITSSVKEYTLQYSTDGNNWNDYTGPGTMTQNGVIYARLRDSTGQIGGYATGNVANIDKVEPNNFTPTVAATTNSITVSGSTTDASKTDTNGCSGIARYEYSINNGAWQESNVFSDLRPSTTYQVRMKAIDNAKNERISETINVITGADVISSVTLESGPNKTTYSKLENVDYTGIKLRVKYKYGTVDQIINGIPYSSSTVNNDNSNGVRYNIIVEYNGYKFNITTYKAGWYGIGGEDYWYYTGNGVKVTGDQYLPTSENSSNKRWHYFYDDGRMYTGWRETSSGWVYYIEWAQNRNQEIMPGADNMKPNYERGSKLEETMWLYLKDPTNTISKVYYIKNGIMQTGWLQLSNEWYYLKSNGVRCSLEWLNLDGFYYYFKESGIMYKEEWAKVNGIYYYFKADGKMYNNEWLNLDGNWYYFKSNGAMCCNEDYTVNGKVYNFNSNGVCTNP